MESTAEATVRNWTEEVEDLLLSEQHDQAIVLLESIVSNLENELGKEELGSKISGNPSESSSSAADQLSTALHDLSKLYSTKGFSLKADQTRSRALQIKLSKGVLPKEDETISDEFSKLRVSQNEATSPSKTAEHETSGEDDWEAMADRSPEELLSPQNLPGIAESSSQDSKAQTTKRRGRGTFSYQKQGLYSDYQYDEPVDESENDPAPHTEDPDKTNLICGTRHVLVLANFPPSTRRTDLEKLLEQLKDHFVIRWVNDTTALAVFKTPHLALEAMNSIRCSFTIRTLNEDDKLLTSIPPKDLDPPRQRPQTSARTANRMIAQAIGKNLPSEFGSSELRKQEAERKNRIISRQNMKDDAWGDDA